MNLIEIGNLTEEQAREHLEKIRWPNGPVCPHCNGTVATRLQGKTTRPGLLKCKTAGCRKPFTVTMGTIFEDSHLTCKQWLIAFHLMCSSKKGVSSHQLHRELGITYKSAWHLSHRIRWAMKKEPLKGMLGGEGETVEVDETYVGGKPRKGTGPHKRGRGTKKTPVMVLVERDGSVVSQPVGDVSAATLKGAIREMVDEQTKINTDELASYTGLGDEFKGGHETVNHSAGEYSKTSADGSKVHINTAESFFALFKRGVHGIFHHVSKKHLHRYCDEFDFRWDHRIAAGVNDSERTDAAIKGSVGKRLMYSAPIGSLIETQIKAEEKLATKEDIAIDRVEITESNDEYK